RWRLPAAGHELRGVRLLERADPLAVRNASQLVDGGSVHTRIGVDEVLSIRRVLDRMIAVALRQCDQSGAVEVDAVIMDQVRILIRILAAGTEPDLPACFVDAVDTAHDILAPGNLVLDLAERGID